MNTVPSIKSSTLNLLLYLNVSDCIVQLVIFLWALTAYKLTLAQCVSGLLLVMRKTNSKVRIKYLAKRHNAVPPVSTRSLIEHFTCSSVLDPHMAGVFLVTGLKILGRVGTHIFLFFFYFFFNFMQFERHFAFQNA